ncbi:hypothetical protein GcM3_115023, partial [Golovinomyces cichoracearum]
MWTSASRFEDLASQIRQPLDQMHYMKSTGMTSSSFLSISDEAGQEVQNDSFLVDCQYNRCQKNAQGNSSSGNYHGNNIVKNEFPGITRQKSRDKYFEKRISSPGSNSRNYGAFLTEYEGHEEDEEKEDSDDAYKAEDYCVFEKEEEQKPFAAAYISNEAFRHQ